MNLRESDELFLEDAMMYISDAEVSAAHEMLTYPELTLSKACAFNGSSPIVVSALQGKLKEVVIRKGKVAPGDRYVDPRREPAVIDSSNKRQLAAFSIWRTLECRQGQLQLFERGSAVN